MNERLRQLNDKLKFALKTSKGHNLLVFLVFLVIATLLWFVSSLNEEVQADVRMKVKLTHVPDSVTMVSRIPETMSVSLSTKGTQILKLQLGSAPEFEIDYRMYRSGGALRLSNQDLKAIARNALDGASIIVVSPDSLILAFTSQPPVMLPVHLDYNVTPGPNATISGKPSLSLDSVRVYTIGQAPVAVEAITTEPLRINSLAETTVHKVALVAPRGSRVVPDSIDVTIKVEPLIFKTRKVTVETINAPADVKLITFPTQVDVNYMIPVSQYKSTEPHIRVVADYRTIAHKPSSRMIRLKVAEASDNLQNVHLVADSAEFYIEKL